MADLKALLLKPGKAVQHGMMLKPGGDQVLLALACAEAGGGEDGLIIGLAATGGKDYLARAFRAEAVGHGLSGLGDILRHLLGEGVKARGVAVVLGQVRHHREKRRGLPRDTRALLPRHTAGEMNFADRLSRQSAKLYAYNFVEHVQFNSQ